MSDGRIEPIIIGNLVANKTYASKVLPFISLDYFSDSATRTVFELVKDFYEQHSTAPSANVLKVELTQKSGMKQTEYDSAMELVDNLPEAEANVDWLIENTEKFCKDKAILNAITEAIYIADGKSEKHSRDAIPKLLQDALSVSFEKDLGHDYIGDAEKRFEKYHTKAEKIPFHIDMLNKVTGGGIERKTLSCTLAGTGVGKSLFMCDYAAYLLQQGFNVLYITLEMAEWKIAERIDCHLMDVSVKEIRKVSKSQFMSKIGDIAKNTVGRLEIKEYPTSGAHVGHFKAHLDELKVKKGFVPDVIFVDYINISLSQRYKSSQTANSYFIIKSIAEELRGMAVEYNAAVFTATQTTRGGFSNTDVEMGDTSESFGLPATLDFYFAVIRTPELDAMCQLMVKQLKSRFGDINYYRRFVIGITLEKFRLHDVDQPTKDIVDGSSETHNNGTKITSMRSGTSMTATLDVDFDFD